MADNAMVARKAESSGKGFILSDNERGMPSRSVTIQRG